MLTKLYFLMGNLSTRIIWAVLMVVLVLYHLVGERMGLPHGFESQIELWALGITPHASDR